MRKLMAIALLPAHCMAQAFEDMVDTADADITMYFQDLIAYYRRQWLRKVGLRRYSVYNRIHRTNNPLESYHRILGMFMMQCRRNIWIFTECILDVAVKARREVHSMSRGLPVRREIQVQYVRVELMLDRAWDLFVRNVNPVQYRKFLTVASHIFGGFGKDLLCTTVDQIAEFQDINVFEDEGEMFPDMQLYMVRDDHQVDHVLHRTGCLMCNCKFLATNMILPCYHWAGCRICTQRSLQQATEQNQILLCSSCHNPAEWFVELAEERQIGK